MIKIFTLITSIILLACSPTCAQMLILPNGDTLKGAIKKMTTYDGAPSGNWRIKWVYVWDTSTKKIDVDIYTKEGGLLGKQLVRYDECGNITELSLLCNDNSPCQQNLYTYNKAGTRLMERRFVHYMLTKNFQPSKCNTLLDNLMGGITEWFGNVDSVTTTTQYKYNSAGKVVWAKVVDATIGYNYTDTTVAILTYRHYDNGEVASKTKEEIKIRDGTADTSMEIINYKYDIKAYDTTTITETINLWPDYYDTSVEINNRTHRAKDNKLIKKLRLSFRKESSWPDTTEELTEYKYDERGNKIEDWWYTDHHTSHEQNWQYEGRDVTRRTTYKYDEQNNLIDKRTYLRESDFYAELHGKNRPGMLIAKGNRIAYDQHNHPKAYTEYRLYIDSIGVVTEHIIRQSEAQQTEEEEKQVDEQEAVKDGKTYDEQGNITREIRNGKVIYTREIEYY